MNYPTQAELKEFFDCNFEAGELFWKHRKDASKKWNTRWAGKKAGALDGLGYYRVSLNRRRYRVHTIILLMAGETFNDGEEADHIDHDRTNNRLENLRKVSKTTNTKNKSMRSDNTSGITGVFWHNKNRKWIAQTYINGKKRHLGCFDDISEAVEVVKKFREENGYHANHGQ